MTLRKPTKSFLDRFLEVFRVERKIVPPRYTEELKNISCEHSDLYLKREGLLQFLKRSLMGRDND